VNAEPLSRAVTASKLPLPLLALFQKAGRQQAAAHLIRRVRKHGANVLCQNPTKYDPLGLCCSEIMVLPGGRDGAATATNLLPDRAVRVRSVCVRQGATRLADCQSGAGAKLKGEGDASRPASVDRI